MSGFVYAIAADDGLVKIGFTTQLFARLSQLQSSSPMRLTPLGAIRATQDQETALHQLLAADNEKGEWFRRGSVTEYFLSRLPRWPARHRKVTFSDGNDPVSVARLRLGLNQAEMARALGVTQATVSRWEADKQPISQLALKAVEQLVSERKQGAAA